MRRIFTQDELRCGYCGKLILEPVGEPEDGITPVNAWEDMFIVDERVFCSKLCADRIARYFRKEEGT